VLHWWLLAARRYRQKWKEVIKWLSWIFYFKLWDNVCYFALRPFPRCIENVISHTPFLCCIRINMLLTRRNDSTTMCANGFVNMSTFFDHASDGFCFFCFIFYLCGTKVGCMFFVNMWWSDYSGCCAPLRYRLCCWLFLLSCF